MQTQENVFYFLNSKRCYEAHSYPPESVFTPLMTDPNATPGSSSSLNCSRTSNPALQGVVAFVVNVNLTIFVSFREKQESYELRNQLKML